MATDNEAVQFANQMIAVLSNNEDQEFKEITDVILSNQVQFQQLMQIRERSLQEAIRALSADCEQAEQAVQHCSERERAQQEAEKAQTETEQAEKNKETIQQQVATLRSEHDDCQQQSKKLNTERQNIEHNTSKVLPSCRHDANIYTHLTCIRWQYDCPPEEIKGYVSNKNKLRTFSLNSTQNSKFFIANYLWDLIEPDW